MNNDFLRDVKATLWDVTVESEDLISQIKDKMNNETDEEKISDAQDKIENLEVGMNNLKILSSELERAFQFQELRISEYRDALINDRSAVMEDQEINDYAEEDINEETYDDEEMVEEETNEDSMDEEAVTEVEPEMEEEQQPVINIPDIESITGELPEEESTEEVAVEEPAVEETVVEEAPAAAVEEQAAPEEPAVEESVVEEAPAAAVEEQVTPETPAVEEAVVEEAPAAAVEAVVETPVQEAPVENVATDGATESVIPAVVDAPTEAVAEEKPAEDVVLEIPKVGDTVEPGAPEVEDAPANVQPLEEAPVAEAQPAVTLEPETEGVVYEQQGTMQDRGVLVNTSQANNSRASFDNQNALYTSINKPAEAQTEAVAEQPAAEAQPAVAETPASNQQELEQMMQQMQEAYASGDTAKAEELSNAISEKNKTLQKTAA